MSQGVKSNIFVVCPNCGAKFKTIPSCINKGEGKFCSKKCYGASYKKGSVLANKIKDKYTSRVPWNKGLELDYQKGSGHWNWKGGISFRKRDNLRNDSAYVVWRKEVWKRDKYKCKIDNPDCKGRIEAHHILGWTEYPKLRYETNNGITLCHYHHPRKKVAEKRLIPFLKGLVINN